MVNTTILKSIFLADNYLTLHTSLFSERQLFSTPLQSIFLEGQLLKTSLQSIIQTDNYLTLQL